jgi:hypothetical protein
LSESKENYVLLIITRKKKLDMSPFARIKHGRKERKTTLFCLINFHAVDSSEPKGAINVENSLQEAAS